MAKATIDYTEKYAPVGAIVKCGYWGYVYQVVAHNADGSVTVREIADHPESVSSLPARTEEWSHRTPLNPRRDRILSS